MFEIEIQAWGRLTAHRWWGSAATQQGKQSFIWPPKMTAVAAERVQPLDTAVFKTTFFY